MEKQAIRQLLEQVKQEELTIDEALKRLAILPFASFEESRIDHHRALRRGFPEVIFAQGKTPEQVAKIFSHLCEHHEVVLATRVDAVQAEAVRSVVADVTYDSLARCLYRAPENLEDRGRGEILVLAAGTSDLPVAREAYLTAQLMGNRMGMLVDVGVAGLHRLLGELERVRAAEILIVVAGMEGALPSVVAGLVDRPLVAVPTSIGYGVGMGGIAALMTMLNSCAAGVTVVNIDNGFGAAYAASLMNRRHG
ncbi:MAG: nickel pincer cofactor biosynthesis protein LarB [Myxococcales bacterium]|nr:nickel pincer cofactor biosynthesis protein LarB [Myxococcales bacterium]MCB9643032.1 nickel pincer cofactor biosynthesis protein LarB [Myxococcales bacterium]